MRIVTRSTRPVGPADGTKIKETDTGLYFVFDVPTWSWLDYTPTEDELRLERVVAFADLRRQDESIGLMATKVCAANGVASIGELARQNPAVFDEVYSQALAMADLDDELEKYIAIRGTRPSHERTTP